MTHIQDNLQVPPPQLAGLISALPEIYQTIFGHPEYSERAARDCEARLRYILDAYDAVKTYYKRPLRVLDLGCAQGYFSLELAARGASVVGIDFRPENIAVCKALAAEHTGFNIEFQVASVEQTIARLLPNQFDFILGLSVFHHLVHAYGAQRIQPLLARLMEFSGAGLFEFALAEEPPAWAASQPKYVRELLGDTAFVHELARIPNHLSEIERPLYFASNALWFFGQSAERFTTWSQESHRFVGYTFLGTRRYYFSENAVAKVFALEKSFETINRREIANEVRFLREFDEPRYEKPQLFAHGETRHEAWLVRERISGTLLSTAIDEKRPFDAHTVIGDVLRELALLESKGLYHADVRLWNVLLTDGGRARLIDFGAVSTDPKDCLWPQNLFFTFFIFVWAVTTRSVYTQAPTLPAVASPFNLPEPYRGWSMALWQQPVSNWSFKEFLARFEQIEHAAPAVPEAMRAIDVWMGEMEQFCQLLGLQQQKLMEELAKVMNTQAAQDDALKRLASGDS